jgi:hypothetical protein
MKRLPGLMWMFSLAEALHIDIDEVMAMPCKRLTYWRAYYNIKAAEHEREMAESQARARARGRVR